MTITEVLREEDIIPSLSATTKEGVLAELAVKMVERHSDLQYEKVLAVLAERERLGSTGIGDGIAIPHGKVNGMENLALIFGRSEPGVEFKALDGRPSHLFFLLLAPEEAVAVHLKMLARISRILKDPAVRERLRAAPDAAAIFSIIREQDRVN